MKEARRSLLLFVLGSLLAGCNSTDRVSSILLRSLPSDAAVTISSSCTPLFGPIVALFSLSTQNGPISELALQANGVDGHWSHQESLSEFAETDHESDGPLGIGATILDGKPCLRSLSKEADTVLFGELPGLYYRSDDREVVIVIPDSQRGVGVLFVKAP